MRNLSKNAKACVKKLVQCIVTTLNLVVMAVVLVTLAMHGVENAFISVDPSQKSIEEDSRPPNDLTCEISLKPSFKLNLIARNCIFLISLDFQF